MENRYDPNQPRVPAGHHGGGQWTSGGRWEALIGPQKKEVSGRDSGKSDSDGHSEELIAKPAFLDTRPSGNPRIAGFQAVLALLGWWWSNRNRTDRVAILDFSAREYLREGPKSLNFKDVHVLERSEIGKFCERLAEVQGYTDEAYRFRQFVFRWRDAKLFGTAVHAEVAKKVRAVGSPDFLAEKSMEKINQEFPDNEKALSQEERNKRDLEKELMVRIDVLENIPDKKTVCVYDIKTGESGLNGARMDEIVRAVFGKFKDTMRIVIVQVRPGQR